MDDTHAADFAVGRWRGQPKEASKPFFFEKKNQKTFICYGHHPNGPFEPPA
jgi:hypothetical protein